MGTYDSGSADITIFGDNLISVTDPTWTAVSF